MDIDSLYAAAIAGDADAIVKPAMEADKRNEYGETILHVESQNGNTERVRFILREFANKNLLVEVSTSKRTALHLAAYGGHTEVAKILIDAARHLPVTSFQGFLRQGDEDMDTALHAAVRNHKVAIVKLLAEADPTDTHIQNCDGKTPMYIAVEKGYVSIVEIISTTCTAPSLDGPDGSTAVRIKNLDQGKSPAGRTSYKIMDRYALYVAAIAGDADAIAKLEMQANIINVGEESVLHAESEIRHAERVRSILREFAKKNLLATLNSEEQNALHLAAKCGHTEVAEILIDVARHLPPSDNENTHDNPVTSFQAFLRQPDKEMNTPLHRAVMEGHASIVKLIVEVDPSDRHNQNGEGKSPMYIAVEKGYNDVVEIISTKCTAPSFDGPNGSSAMRVNNLDQAARSPGGTLYRIMDKDALYAAAIAGDTDAIAALEMQADKLNKDKETILHTESERGNTEHVRFILREFASKNLLVKLTIYKHTALHLALYEGHTEVAEILIDAARHLPVTSFQAFLRQGDKDMDTALHAAVMEGNEAIVKLLVEADPTDTHIQNIDEGKTPMYIAVEKGYDNIVEIISTTCTAPSLDGPDGSTALRIKNLDQGKSPGGITLYKIMDRYALYVAAIAGDADAIAKLEMQANIINVGEESVLHAESEIRHAERVRSILREFAKKNLLATLNWEEQNALHLAAVYGQTEVAKILIDVARHLPPSDNENTHDNPVTSFQAFLRQPDEDLNTPLHRAVMEGHTSIVKLLVEADPSDRHIQNDEGKSPMYIAVEKGYSDIVEIISTTCTAPSLDGPDGSTAMRVNNLDQAAKSPGGTLYKIMDRDALYTEANDGDADCMAALQMQADKQNKDKETILHTESKNGNAEHVSFILRELANKNLLVKLDNQKKTALHYALFRGHTGVAEILIDAARQLLPSDNENNHDNPVTSFQAFLRQCDNEMNTALHIAVKQGNFATATLLVEADPSDKHVRNNQGKTPIYIAAESGYYDTVKMIFKTCTTPPNLEGPGGSTTVLHAAIKNLNKGRKENWDVIEIIIDAVEQAIRHQSVYEVDDRLVRFFNRTDENKSSVLELAVEENHLDVVELILTRNPAYGFWSKYPDIIGILPLSYKVMDNENNDMFNLLTQTYQTRVRYGGLLLPYATMVEFIYAISSRNKETVLKLLKDDKCAKDIVTFADNLGWTALHHAAYYEFDSIIHDIVEAQKKFKHSFVYRNMVSTPFHVASEKGNTSTVTRLMELWPSWSSAVYSVDKNGQNILHLAALQSNKEMIQNILENCSEYKKEFVNEQDNNDDTPLHILVGCGCFVPQLLRYEGLDIWLKNKKRWTPPEMLYFEEKIIKDQVLIKVALDDIQIDIFSSSVLPSKRMRKVTLNKLGETILHVESKKGDVANVQFIVSAFASKSLLGKLDRSKQTALHLAAHHGHTKVVEALIDAARQLPSSTNIVSSFQNFIRQANGQPGNTALHLAVLENNVAIVKLLVEADPNDNHVRNNEGKTPIYIAAENGYKNIVKVICTTCTALSLEGPDCRTTALHAFIKNISQVTEGANDVIVIRMMVIAAKRWSCAEDPSLEKFKALFSRTDESGSTVLQLAIERNYVEAVKLILPEDPAYQHDGKIKRSILMRLIFKAIDKEYSDDVIKSLSDTYKAGINQEYEDVLPLILAIKKRDEESVLKHLRDAKKLVTFKEDNGWTPLHYAVYHEFDSILGEIIESQGEHPLLYEDRISTPFHVAVKCGYTSTLKRLMQSWPTPTSSVNAANYPYTAANEIGQNILHLAAAGKNKEMIQNILEYCPENYREEIMTQQDNNGDTPLHLLIINGWFIPQLIEYKKLLERIKNTKGWTPQELLYFQSEIIGEQVQIKMALDDLKKDMSAESKKKDIWGSLVFPSRRKMIPLQVESKKEDRSGNLVLPSMRKMKDVLFDERMNLLREAEDAKKRKDQEIYNQGTNSQIVVSALITTITFTVGFTMPGGLHQSEEVDAGLAVFSKKAAFNAFIIFDVLALLLSSCSLFIYFLESMYDDPFRVLSLRSTTTVLNIVSVMLMMLIFITGTYLVLSESLILAITVCVIGSLFFLFVIVQLMKFVLRRGQKKRN